MKFTANNVFLDVNARNINSFLQFASKAARDAGYTDDISELDRSFLEREKEFSTGLEDGFAIPHAKTTAVSKPGFLYFRLVQPIKWKTYDDQPVTDVFTLMVPPENAGTEHLRMLANLSTALLENEFKKKLRELTTKQEIAAFINQKIGE